MHKIIMWCDVVLFPVVDPDQSPWCVPKATSGVNVFEEKACPLRRHTKSAWCVLELLCAAVLPVPEGSTRSNQFKPGVLHACLNSSRRLFIIAGKSLYAKVRSPASRLQRMLWSTY